MTISTLIRKTIAAGDGVTTAFNFAFQVRSAADLQVYYTDAGGVQALLASNLYSVVLNPIPSGQLWSNGGTVTYPLVGTAIAAGTKLTVARNLSLLQSSSLINQGGYYSDVVEAALDVLTMEMQQVNETIARALTLPISSTATTALPNPLAGAAIGWDATGTFITNIVNAGNIALPVIVAQGGTGSITAAGARANLKAPTATRNANVILAAADIGELVIASGTFTQTLTAAATLGDGWYCDYRNDGTGIITLDPNGAELIDGAQTLKLYRGESCRIWCNGAAFKTQGRGTGLVLIDSQVAAAVATIDFTQGFSTDFDEYVLSMTDIVPATDGANLQLRISQAAVFKAGANDYGYAQGGGTSAPAAFNTGAVGTSSSIVIASALSSVAPRTFSGKVELFNPGGAALGKAVNWKIGYISTAPAYIYADGFGFYIGTTSGTPTAAIDGLRFLMSAGNITSGNFALWGARKT